MREQDPAYRLVAFFKPHTRWSESNSSISDISRYSLAVNSLRIWHLFAAPISTNQRQMLRTYIQQTARRLLRDRQSTLLNLIGLSTGLACAFLIYLWVSDERSVDRFNEKDRQLYLVIKNSPNADGTIYTSETTQGLLANSMKADLPEVEDAVSVRIESSPGVV